MDWPGRRIQSNLKLYCEGDHGTIGVNFEINVIFPKVHKSHRAVAGLDVPTDAPSAEPVPDQSEEIIGLVIVVYAEAPVIAFDATQCRR